MRKNMRLKFVKSIIYGSAIFLGLGLVFPRSGAAQELKKVGYVDVERLRSDSKMISAEVKKYDREIRNMQNQIDGLTAQYQKLKTDYDRQKSVLSDAQLAERQDEMRDLAKTIREMQDRTRDMLQEIDRTVFEPIIKQVATITNRIAKEENYDLVLRGDFVLYANKEYDLTDRIIEVLDQELEAAKQAKEDGAGEKSTGEPAAMNEEKKTEPIIIHSNSQPVQTLNGGN